MDGDAPYWLSGLEAIARIRTVYCKSCGERLPATDEFFSRYPSGKHRGTCKACRAAEERRRLGRDPAKRKASTNAWRAANREKMNAAQARAKLRRKYGLTSETWAARLITQGGGCAICAVEQGGGRHGKFHVDHCHVTGRVRGLLCHNCNTAIGLFADDANRLQRAAEYVSEARSGVVRKVRVKRASVKQEENTVLMEAA
jgi:hypothetical protein